MKQIDRTAAGFTDRAVPFVEFDYEAIDRAVPDDAPIRARAEELDRLRIVQAVFQLLQATTKDPAEIGRKVQVFGHLLTQQESQAAAAKRIGLSPSRFSEVKTALMPEFKIFSDLLLRCAERN